MLVRQKEGLKLALRYKATRDGFSANNFWGKVKGLVNCFVFVEAVNGNRFGGFRTLEFVKG